MCARALPISLALLFPGCALVDELVHDVQHAWRAPRDSASGLATGKRMHKPVFYRKTLSASSARLLAHELAHVVQQGGASGGGARAPQRNASFFFA